MRAAALAALLALAALPAAAACVDIDATEDWVALEIEGAVLDVYAAGQWTADAGRLRPVGPAGHPADAEAADGVRLAPPYALGALILANGERRVWDYRTLQRAALGALVSGQPFVPGNLYARINDTAGGLGDNAGSVTLCIETVPLETAPGGTAPAE